MAKKELCQNCGAESELHETLMVSPGLRACPQCQHILNWEDKYPRKKEEASLMTNIVKVANELDQLGYEKEADVLTDIMCKIADVYHNDDIAKCPYCNESWSEDTPGYAEAKAKIEDKLPCPACEGESHGEDFNKKPLNGPAKIAKLRSIVENKQYAKVDNVTVDLFTASVVLMIYDNLGKENQAKMAEMPIEKMIDISYKLYDKAKK